MKLHKTKLGDKIPLCDLELSHLENIIKWIEKKSINGLHVSVGGRGNYAEDMWYDEDVLFGKEAKQKLNYKDYILELEKRKSYEKRNNLGV